MSITKMINQIPEEEKTPLVLSLIETIRLQSETIRQLKDEIARLKGNNQKPKIKPSKLENDKKKKGKGKKSKRPGSKKRKKTKSLIINETIPLKPDKLPEGSEFKGFNEYTVQDLRIEPHNTLYLIERWQGPNGEYIVGSLPENIDGHFGNDLKSFDDNT